MAIMGLGEYSNPTPSYTTDGQHGKLQIDRSGSLAVTTRPPFPETLVNAAGASSTTGKIGTVANAAAIYVVCDCTAFPVNYIDWCISSTQQFTYQFYRAASNPLAATITLTDATAVDDGDTFVLNGLTFTAETTEEDALASERKWYHPSQAVGAANLAALLTDATYGVPGISIAVTAPSTTDVLTISATTATCLQFGQGTSDANEVTFADATLINLYQKDAVSSNTAANSTTAGLVVPQTMNGWQWGVLKLTNTSGGAAATFVVNTMRY